MHENMKQRRTSIDTAMLSLADRELVVQRQYDTHNIAFECREKVIRGGLSKVVGDELIAVALCEKHVRVSFMDLRWICAIALFVPLPTGIVFGMLPLRDPSAGFDARFALVVSLASLVSGTGFSFGISAFLGVPGNVIRALLGGLCSAASVTMTFYILAVAWRFPTPMGYLMAASVGVPMCLTANVVSIFGASALLTKPKLRKAIIMPIIITFWVTAFIVVFSFYRIAFERMKPGEQLLFAPLWPLAKVLFKKGGDAMVNKAENPDSGPFVLWFFDAIAACAANLLFLSAGDAMSVLFMIGIDIIENMTLALRVLYRVHRYRAVEHELRLQRLERQGSTAAAERRAIQRDFEELRLSFRSVHVVTDCGKKNSDDKHIEDKVVLVEEPHISSKNNMLLSSAVRILLGFVASETSEILSSLWMCIITLLLYFGSNKAFFFTFRDMDDALLYRALLFSGIDAALELLTFIGLSVFLHISADLSVLSVGHAYAQKLGLYPTVFIVGVSINFLAVCFFSVHFGVDPSLLYLADMASGNFTSH